VGQARGVKSFLSVPLIKKTYRLKKQQRKKISGKTEKRYKSYGENEELGK